MADTKMMTLVYRGSLGSGSVGNGPAYDFIRGEDLELPEDFAKELLRGSQTGVDKKGEPVYAGNPDWHDVTDDTKKSAAKTPAKPVAEQE
ncbi:MAG: hypothetical protein QOG85_2230 [Gaiellaceae bacterium]|nr:hypothetical protein [Gaiellaceae bacterium]